MPGRRIPNKKKKIKTVLSGADSSKLREKEILRSVPKPCIAFALRLWHASGEIPQGKILNKNYEVKVFVNFYFLTKYYDLVPTQ